MTLNELKESVLSLGFEDGFDNDELFHTATRRALHTLSVDRPRISERSLVVLSEGGRLISSAFLHTGGSFERFTIGGRAFSFKVTGSGFYRIEDRDGERTESFGDEPVVRGFIRGDANITFYGENDYLVLSLASFDRRISDRSIDIPVYGERRKIDLSLSIPDFLAPHRLPTDKYGFELSDARIRDGILSLPYGFSGEIYISYKRRFSLPDFDDGDSIIDLSSECEELLPLLVAFYVWLDDDAEKAEIYLSLYKDALASIKRSNQRLVGASYLTNGWA